MTAPVTIEMRVHKYIPDRLYGFAIDDSGQEVFFHLGVFDSGTSFGAPSRCSTCSDGTCSWASAPPPPILGERVEVTAVLDSQDGRAPRADRVRRLDPAVAVQGEIETFDALRGYGFILGADKVSYHLHKSEMLDGRLPVAGLRVSFFAGTRQGRPRACHIKVCP
jgi:cold shock CspA family protein